MGFLVLRHHDRAGDVEAMRRHTPAARGLVAAHDGPCRVTLVVRQCPGPCRGFQDRATQTEQLHAVGCNWLFTDVREPSEGLWGQPRQHRRRWGMQWGRDWGLQRVSTAGLAVGVGCS